MRFWHELTWTQTSNSKRKWHFNFFEPRKVHFFPFKANIFVTYLICELQRLNCYSIFYSIISSVNCAHLSKSMDYLMKNSWCQNHYGRFTTSVIKREINIARRIASWITRISKHDMNMYMDIALFKRDYLENCWNKL